MTITTAPVTLPPITSPERTAFLCQRMVGTVSTALGTPPDDPRVRGAITDVVQFFLAAGGRAEVAAHDAQRVVRSLAVELSAAGLAAPELDRLFRSLHGVVMSTLGQVAGEALRGEAIVSLRHAAQRYLHLVCATMTTELRRESARREHRRAQWLAEVGAAGDPRIDATRPGRVRALVSVDRELPEVLRADPRLIARPSAYELLVPEDIDPHTLAAAVAGQVVVGPLTPWSDLGGSLQLLWRAARLLSDGQAVDDRVLVPCTEMLGPLLVAGNPLLTGLLASKHLSVLDGIRPARRKDLALTLLRWLESASATNQLARDMGVPPQTLHSRLCKLRELFGPKLEDPPVRLELIVALRSVLPTWGVAV